MMYTTTTTITARFAISATPISGPHFQPSRSESTTAKIDSQTIATCGVLNVGWVRPSGRGARRFRARGEKTRVAAFTAAFEFAVIEFTIARKTRIQPVLQKTLPRFRHGSAPVACATKLSKPAPKTHAYEHRM